MLSFEISEIRNQSLTTFRDTVASNLASLLHHFETSEFQIEAWRKSAVWIHEAVAGLDPKYNNLRVIFELEPPLSTERPDVVIVGADLVLVIEAKTGTEESVRQAKNQVLRYARNIFNYVDVSRSKMIIPVLLRPGGKDKVPTELQVKEPADEHILDVSPDNLSNLITLVKPPQTTSDTDPDLWLFHPRPSIVDAARLMFSETSSKEVLHSLANDEELEALVETCERLTTKARNEKKHYVLAVTGVPGAGKTLVGLRLANSNSIHSLCNEDGAGTPLYLSGNGPLVDVLTEALARDERKRRKCTAEEAREIALAKIRLIHGLTTKKFAVKTNVLVFDEAQRAWTEERMRSKMQKQDLLSEAEEVLQRMESAEWAVVICLVGTGQQINDGERGMLTWTSAIAGRRNSGRNWEMFGSATIAATDGADTTEMTDTPDLHLSIVRRADNASMLGDWVASLLGGQINAAAKIREEFANFPIFITRNLEIAKEWLRDPLRPHYETFGLLASSKSARLSSYGIDAQSAAGMTHDWTQWFLDKPPNLNSSEVLEVAASEFKCQGLELDRTCVCWSWDMIFSDGKWITRRIDKRKGKWNQNESRRDYAINAYRVLLTRARAGMIIWVPEGDTAEESRDPHEMDKVAEVLIAAGCQQL